MRLSEVLKTSVLLACSVVSSAFAADLPGQTKTNASATLQKDAAHQLIFWDTNSPAGRGCQQRRVVDTRLLEGSGLFGVASGGWRELWIVDRCGQVVEFELQFSPDGRGGTLILVTEPSRSATRRPVSEDHKRCDEAHRTRDWATALTICRPLAEQGDSTAQAILGFMFANAQGVQQDDVVAAKWFRSSADQGNPLGQIMLGSMYGAGDGGLTRDPAEASRFYALAAQQGLPNAQFYLAMAYFQGVGIKQDTGIGTSWLRRAAEQGFLPAQVNLALAYRDGTGVAQDDFSSYFWLTIAARNIGPGERGQLDEIRERVRSQLAPERQKEVTDLADRWTPTLEPARRPQG